MKSLLKLTALFVLAVTLVTTGCKKDPDVTPETPPSLEILTTGYHDTITTLDTSALYALDVKAEAGSADLKLVTVYRDGVKADLEDFRINDEQPSANPILLVGDTLKNGFTWKIAVRSPSTFSTSTSYKIEVEDENGNTASGDILVVVGNPATPIDVELTGKKFYNNAGLMEGGIDLLNGSAQSTVSGNPHIFDNGLDNNGNWKKTISPASGVVLRMVDANNAIAFGDISTKEEIAGMFALGTDITETPALSGGEMFTAVVNGTTVIFRIDEVVETANDNNDFYTISIKY